MPGRVQLYVSTGGILLPGFSGLVDELFQLEIYLKFVALFHCHFNLFRLTAL